jgi:subtilisin family serine protease
MLLAWSSVAVAQDKYLLVTSPSKVSDVCGRHSLTQVATPVQPGSNGVYLVSSSTVDPTISSDSAVVSFEPNSKLGVPELSALSTQLTQSTGAIIDQLPSRAAVSYFGATVANYYVSQSATSVVELGRLQNSTLVNGQGITIAVIDTGVDPSHPALINSLVQGYDFTRNQQGASELPDLPSAAQAALSQSTGAIIDGQNVMLVNPSTAAILSQTVSSTLGQVPEAFGHGTMTAGLVHLIAPGARIMPLKAFNADGSSDLFNIVRAITFAADNGANVISMSFEIPQSSPALQNAIQYAQSKNVVLVASSGNDGQQTMVYPAGYNGVIGVASTTASDSKSVFTNFGTNAAFVAAPGEAVITTYPAGNYAAGWGTSFSAPLVAGEAALILQARPTYKPGDVANAISRAVQIPQLGHGRVDLCLSIASIGAGLQCQ